MSSRQGRDISATNDKLINSKAKSNISLFITLVSSASRRTNIKNVNTFYQYLIPNGIFILVA
jgi:hypothetical protein